MLGNIKGETAVLKANLVLNGTLDIEPFEKIPSTLPFSEKDLQKDDLPALTVPVVKLV